MIAWLQGKIVDRSDTGNVVLEVGGVGYDVDVSLSTLAKLEFEHDKVGLYIHTVVREDAFLLYGFLDKEERVFFRGLLKVNGIGPKVAMQILSSVTPQECLQAILQENRSFLQKLPGVGKKMADRLCVELKDFAESQVTCFSAVGAERLAPELQEAIAALEALGYKHHEVMQVIRTLPSHTRATSLWVKEALRVLSQKCLAL
ncbi:MAG: Holliday junction branch migration protein RuvA [Legionellaceae bacterium]|nr:Holliday junction branch migration protein RuvA [Legionellaceae bacterium]